MTRTWIFFSLILLLMIQPLKFFKSDIYMINLFKKRYRDLVQEASYPTNEAFY